MLRCAASQANLYLRIIGGKYGGETLVYGVIDDKTIQPARNPGRCADCFYALFKR